jgi:hypothetical protein
MQKNHTPPQAPVANTQVPAVTASAPPWAHTIREVLLKATPPNKIKWGGPLFHLLPYCIQGMSDQNHRCIVNRNYKPIGHVGRDFVQYEQFPGQHISVEAFEVLRAIGAVDSRGYLHNDGNTPRIGKKDLAIYRAKLAAMIAPWVEFAPAADTPLVPVDTLRVFRVTDRDNDRDIETIAGLLQDLVGQRKSGMKPRRWLWTTGKQIDDMSTFKAISSRVKFEKLDTSTNTWQPCPCPMMYAMRVNSGLYFSGGRKS